MIDKKLISQLRMKFIRAYHQGISVSEIARKFNTSRNIVNKWIKRYKVSNIDGLSDQSRKPKHSPNKTDQSILKRILTLREKIN